MKNAALPLIVALVIAGAAASLAATGTSSTEPALGGRFVVVDHPDVPLEFYEKSRFESVGQHDFIVVPMQQTETTGVHACWNPLKDVSLLRVFYSKDDAANFIKWREGLRGYRSSETGDGAGAGAE